MFTMHLHFISFVEGVKCHPKMVRSNQNKRTKWILTFVYCCITWLCWSGHDPYTVILCPSAIHCCNDKGQLPLHVACRGDVIPDVIKLLREFYPRAIGRIDNYGKTPSNYIATQNIPLLTESEEMLYNMFHNKCIEMYCFDTEIDSDMDI